ncbi:hypothetical protein AB0F24_03910 [Streptomyces platensis]|uniref:hypothetical protein n=1 Tax=Streptomyces platensis TaxID=58346 RepID=UPI00340D4EDB
MDRRGWSVTVLERAAALEPVGAGIGLAPNAQRAPGHPGRGRRPPRPGPRADRGGTPAARWSPAGPYGPGRGRPAVRRPGGGRPPRRGGRTARRPAARGRGTHRCRGHPGRPGRRPVGRASGAGADPRGGR